MRNPVKVTENNRSGSFSTRDLLIVAVLSGFGGVMSTYIGYLGNLVNRFVGVPFGAGQFVAGLHVLWLILVAGLIQKPGAGLAAGLLKGTVELFTGSTHGVAIVLVSFVQGALIDFTFLLLKRYNLFTYSLAGGIAAFANVVVFQILYFSGAPWSYLLLISVLAFVSGVLFAGCFGKGITDIIIEARPTRITSENLSQRGPKKYTWFNFIIIGLLVLVFSVGAIYYFSKIYESPWSGPQCQVEGEVERAYTFGLSHFSAAETTITAELKGQVTYAPPQDYTGIPVKEILKEARVNPGASTLKVIASDGYEVDFSLAKVMEDEGFILIEEGDFLRLIARDYEGGYWVRQVKRLVIVR